MIMQRLSFNDSSVLSVSIRGKVFEIYAILNKIIQ